MRSRRVQEVVLWYFALPPPPSASKYHSTPGRLHSSPTLTTRVKTKFSYVSPDAARFSVGAGMGYSGVLKVCPFPSLQPFEMIIQCFRGWTSSALRNLEGASIEGVCNRMVWSPEVRAGKLIMYFNTVNLVLAILCSTTFRVSVFVLARVIMVLWEFTELTFVVLGKRVEILSTAPATRLDLSQSKSVGCSLERSTSAAWYAQWLHLEVWYVDPIINMDPTYAQPKNFNTSSVSKLLSVNSSISKPEGPESRTS